MDCRVAGPPPPPPEVVELEVELELPPQPATNNEYVTAKTRHNLRITVPLGKLRSKNYTLRLLFP
jgi:hypothetical protein